MGIKIRGLEAFRTLCGGGSEEQDQFQGDGLTGVVAVQQPKSSGVSILDKYTIQEKVIPLMRVSKRKSPQLWYVWKPMFAYSILILKQMAALDVFKAISGQLTAIFLAMDVLPIIWQFSLGPLLNLPQFQAYMALIKTMSARVENEQTRKLQELGANNATATTRNEFMSFGGPSVSNGFDTSNGNAGDADFEALVRGGPGTSENPDMLGGDPWANAPASASSSTVLLHDRLSTALGRRIILHLQQPFLGPHLLYQHRQCQTQISLHQNHRVGQSPPIIPSAHLIRRFLRLVLPIRNW